MTGTSANVRRLAALCVVLFAVLAGATLYWGFWRASTLAARPDNPRRAQFERRIARGRILDRHGTVLAETRFDNAGQAQRLYPNPSAAPVVGFQTWRYGAGGLPGVSYGAGGAEAAYDTALRGNLGLGLRELALAQLLHRPQQGHDIVLTLDGDLQAFAAELLGEREGAVVVLDIESGAIRALVSQPTFEVPTLDRGEVTADDPRRRLLNRATQGLYPPGSIWKTVTLAAALEEGLAQPEDMVTDGDAEDFFGGFGVRCNNNPEGVNSFDIAHAFAYSCNLTFARLADALGVPRFREHARRFGIGDPIPFPLPTTRSLVSADPEMSAAELASAGFGQGEVLVTPLQMALVAAAVGGDGTVPVPYLLEDVPDVAHRSIADERGVWRRAMSSGVTHQMRQVMTLAVTDGWARSAVAGLGIDAGGKTGTAQLGSGQAPHSWFIGFAPADAPRLAIAVLVAHGGDGASVAAPLAGRVLSKGLAEEE